MPDSRSSASILARLAALTLLLISALGTDELRGGAPAVYRYRPRHVRHRPERTGHGRERPRPGGRCRGGQPRISLAARHEDRPRHPCRRHVRLGLGINEAGQVVGYSARTTPPSGTHAVLWKNGAIVDLTPDVPSNQGASATAINEAGQVVGNLSTRTAFLWQNGTRTPLGHLGGGASFASDINDTV